MIASVIAPFESIFFHSLTIQYFRNPEFTRSDLPSPSHHEVAMATSGVEPPLSADFVAMEQPNIDLQVGGCALRDPDSKVHGANMGPIWGRQDPGGPHVGPMNFAIWGYIAGLVENYGISYTTVLEIP